MSKASSPGPRRQAVGTEAVFDWRYLGVPMTLSGVWTGGGSRLFIELLAKTKDRSQLAAARAITLSVVSKYHPTPAYAQARQHAHAGENAPPFPRMNTQIALERLPFHGTGETLYLCVFTPFRTENASHFS